MAVPSVLTLPLVPGLPPALAQTARRARSDGKTAQRAERSQMGFAIVTLLVLLLGAFVPPAREDQCACALSNRKLQRKVGAAHQAAISEHFEARAQSAKAPTAVHGSTGAPLVLEHVGWLASQPAKEDAKPTGALMGQTKEEEAGAGAMKRLQLTPHGANLMPSEFVDAEHAINAPRTTPRPTTAEVDCIAPNFKNIGGDPGLVQDEGVHTYSADLESLRVSISTTHKHVGSLDSCHLQACRLGVMQHSMAAHVLMRPPGNNQTCRARTQPFAGDHRPAEVLHPVQLPRRLTSTGGLTSTTRVEPPRIQEVSSGSSACALHCKTQHRRSQRVESRRRVVRTTTLIALAPPSARR